MSGFNLTNDDFNSGGTYFPSPVNDAPTSGDIVLPEISSTVPPTHGYDYSSTTALRLGMRWDHPLEYGSHDGHIYSAEAPTTQIQSQYRHDVRRCIRLSDERHALGYMATSILCATEHNPEDTSYSYSQDLHEATADRRYRYPCLSHGSTDVTICLELG